jgi:DNA primase
MAPAAQPVRQSNDPRVLLAPLAILFAYAHHPCLGLAGGRPYAAVGGKLTVIWSAVDAIKQQISLLDYLQTQNWKPARRISRGRLMGLCPLHLDHKPSFLVDPLQNLFYCYGCGRGGDLIRFVELYHDVSFGEAMTLLRRSGRGGSLLLDVARFYQVQLDRHPEAAAYLQQRGIHQPEVIEEFAIGYAPGRCLRHWLITLGYPLGELQQAGLVNAAGLDTFSHRIVFPLEANLYGRAIGNAAAHRFLPGGKGGLYRWDRVRHYSEVILVEGLFDLVALWQAGFHNATCAMGSHLNARQLRQLCDGVSRIVYLAFDADANASGQQAAQRLSRRLLQQGATALRVQLPDGHDPNSFFVAGGDGQQFQQLLERALP